MTLSDASGKYFFRNLPARDYIVKPDEQAVPDPVTDVFFSMVPTAGGERAVTLAAGQQVLDADFGFASGAVVEGAVFQDNNVIALFDGGDAPLADITVTLTGTDSNNQSVLKTTTTDVNGEFKFLVLAGSYAVTYSYAGPLTATTTSSYLVNPVAGEEVDGLDFVRLLPGAVGDTVYADNNGNGAQDAGEPGLAGVRVALYQGATFTTLIAATTADATGKYAFLNFDDGTYGVRVDTVAGSLPAGYATAPTGDPDAAKDGQGTATLTGGGQNLALDFGYPPTVPLLSVSGNVRQDNGAAGNGVGDGDEPNGGPAGIALAQPVLPQSRGALLYSTHCIACHTKEVHWRQQKLATDWPSLERQVRRWAANGGLAWTDEDVAEVARYLNAVYYRFAAPSVTGAAPARNPG